jgi:hypothetical protein
MTGSLCGNPKCKPSVKIEEGPCIASPRRSTRIPPDVVSLISSSPELQVRHERRYKHHREDVRGADSERKKEKKVKMESKPSTVDLMNASLANSQLKAQKALKENKEVTIIVEMKRVSNDARSNSVLPVRLSSFRIPASEEHIGERCW